jgi:uncharacterized protein YbaA (DUF1428 family)
MAYIDFFVVPLPRGNEDEYKAQAATFLEVMKDYGLIRYCEALADDVPHGQLTDFHRAVAASEGETVVAAFAVWPDRETRNRAWNEGMSDPRLGKKDDHVKLFDGKRLIYGGFTPLVAHAIE